MIVTCPTCKNEIATNAPGRLMRDIEASLTTARKEARAEGRLEGLREADGLSCMTGAIRERIKLLEAAATTRKEGNDE